MCDCIWPTDQIGGRLAEEWIGQGQRVAHPAAPMGGGGGGMFRSAGVLNHDAHDEMLPHSQSPAAPLLAPEDRSGAEQLQAAAATVQPAPRVTSPSTVTAGLLDIVLEIDASGGTTAVGAVTTPVLSHSGSVRRLKNPDQSTVLQFINQKKFKVVIQTVYHRGEPDFKSKYGRGTTAADVAAGNISLGFHESCHRSDLVEHFKTVTQPAFIDPKDLPMSSADFDRALADYLAAWKALEGPANTASLAKTDEVGNPKKSDYHP